jgi:hypothetical protein
VPDALTLWSLAVLAIGGLMYALCPCPPGRRRARLCRWSCADLGGLLGDVLECLHPGGLCQVFQVSHVSNRGDAFELLDKKAVLTDLLVELHQVVVLGHGSLMRQVSGQPPSLKNTLQLSS